MARCLAHDPTRFPHEWPSPRSHAMLNARFDDPDNVYEDGDEFDFSLLSDVEVEKYDEEYRYPSSEEDFEEEEVMEYDATNSHDSSDDSEGGVEDEENDYPTDTEGSEDISFPESFVVPVVEEVFEVADRWVENEVADEVAAQPWGGRMACRW